MHFIRRTPLPLIRAENISSPRLLQLLLRTYVCHGMPLLRTFSPTAYTCQWCVSKSAPQLLVGENNLSLSLPPSPLPSCMGGDARRLHARSLLTFTPLFVYQIAVNKSKRAIERGNTRSVLHNQIMATIMDGRSKSSADFRPKIMDRLSIG